MTNLMTPIGVLRQEIEKGLVGLRVSDYPLINLLEKRSLYQDDYKWQVNVTTTASTGLIGTSAAPAASSDTVVPASVPCGGFRFSETIRLTKNDVTQAAAIGTEPLVELFASHVDSKLKKLMQSIETYLYTGTGNTASGGIIGLDTAIAATGAYAGLNPATSGQEAWSSFISQNVVSTTVTETLFANVRTGILKKGGNFDLIVCGFDELQKYENAFIAAGKPSTLNTRSALLASLGYTVYEYAGRPVIGDVYAPANKFYFLDTKNLKLLTRSNPDSTVVNGLNFQIGQIASDTVNANVYEVSVYPQLALIDRRSAGGLYNTTP